MSRSRGRLTRENIVQIPTCVDLSQFGCMAMLDARKSLGLPLDATIFVTNGRIGRFKGWPLLLDAFVEFRRTRPNALLVFIGDGEERPALQAGIKALGLDPYVKVTGYQQPADVSRYLNSADVVVSASLVEGWSVAMLEALACGKPLVSTDVSGVREMIIPGENGFVMESRTPQQFAKSMQDALYLPNAAAVSTSIARRFGIAEIGRRLTAAWPQIRIEAGQAEFDKTEQTPAAAA